MSLLTLASSYFRCSSEQFAYCYAISSGATMTLFFFLLDVCALLSAVQFGTIDASDPPLHKTLVGGIVAFYWVSFIVSAIAGSVDDQITVYTQTVTESTIGNVKPIDIKSYGFLTEEMWHVLNIIRLMAMM